MVFACFGFSRQRRIHDLEEELRVLKSEVSMMTRFLDASVRSGCQWKDRRRYGLWKGFGSVTQQKSL